jgi:beta-mannosidase
MISLHPGHARLSLDGDWRYCLDPEDRGASLGYADPTLDVSEWPTMRIPANWYLTEVGDYFGTVWFRREFSVPEDMRDERLYLRFGGVDYEADVWLNGTYLGSHEGMFDPFEFDVTDVVDRYGTNALVVRDGAPRDPTEYVQVDFSDSPLSRPYRTHQARAITQIKGHMIDAMHRPGAMTSFRQDGTSGGIWNSVELLARRPIYVEHVRLYAKIGVRKDWLGDGTDKLDGTALVVAHAAIRNETGRATRTRLTLEVAPRNFSGDEPVRTERALVLPPGSSVHSVALTIPEARLWSTWDRGFPHLYTATVRVHSDELEQAFGVKEVLHDDATGQWFLNGERIFLRGMRYISSLWMSEAHERIWSEDLRRMREMEINAIRIGSHVEKDGFYRLCDEMGFLVWQVFPLHYCVSDADDLIGRASDMIRRMGLMLGNHACIGMWSVFKEPEVYLLPDKPNNYHRLCPALRESLRAVDPVRWIHLGDYREGTLNLMIGYCWDGDTHLDEVELHPNIVEVGAGSIPVRQSLERFIPPDRLWPPHWDTWEYHGFFYNLAFNFAKVEMTDSLDAFIDAYQRYEATVVKEQIEYVRQRKYRPVASFFLYYWRDPCPIMGSGLYDYYGRPYRVAASVPSVFRQVLVSLERHERPCIIGREKRYERSSTFEATVWVTNDLRHPIENAVVSWRIASLDGFVVGEHAVTTTIPADAAHAADRIVWKIPASLQPGAYRIEMEVEDRDGRLLSSNATDITVR